MPRIINSGYPKLAVRLAMLAIECGITIEELVRFVNNSQNQEKMQVEYQACKGIHTTITINGKTYSKRSFSFTDRREGECENYGYTDTSKDPWECTDRHGDFLPGKKGLDPVRMVQIVVPLFIVAWVLIFVATLLKEFGIF